jgi:hypothetical protein
MPAKKDILRLYGQYSLKLAQLLKEGVQFDQDEQVSLENHVLIVQLAILQAKHSALRKPAQARI